MWDQVESRQPITGALSKAAGVAKVALFSYKSQVT